MTIQILQGDCRDVLPSLPDQSVHCVVTSPPYFGLRDYGVTGQIGLEPTPDEFVAELVSVFREVRRVLRDDGTLWLNLGDSYCTRSVRRDDGMRTVIKAYETSDAEVGFEKWADYAARGRAKYSSHHKAAGIKDKDLFGIPWMAAFALRADGWYLRSDIIWHKPNPMPESVSDRPTSAHEHIFLLSKTRNYYYDADAIREAESVPDWDDGSRVFGGVNKHGANAQHGRTTGRRAVARKRGLPPRHAQYESSDQTGLDRVGRGIGRNARNVWTVATRPFSEAHFATFPPRLIEPCIKAGSPLGGVVLDPFGGAGTTALVADRLQRSAILIELNPEYVDLARRRIVSDAPLLVTEVTE